MAEKTIPTAEECFAKLQQELALNFNQQRVALVNRIVNTPTQRFAEIHLEEWYHELWKMSANAATAGALNEQEEKICADLFAIAQNSPSPKSQYCALALLLFGKFEEAEKIFHKKIWSKRLIEDYATFLHWHKIIVTAPDLIGRARLDHDRQVKNFLEKKYSYVIERHAKEVISNKTCPKVAPKDWQIYYCWFQGEENLPLLARCCYNSLKENAGDYKIVFIDEKNFTNYIDLPSHVVDKIRSGKITRVHFTDILRVNLLERYGGLWLDATILVTEPMDNYKKFWRLPFYTQKFTQDKDNNHPITKGFGAYSSYGRWGGFIQGTSVLHNPLYTFAKDFFNEYWRDFDELIDYVLVDFVLDIAYSYIPAVKKEMDECPVNNENVWTLSPYLNAPYAQFPYDKILKGNFFNKFSSRKQLDLEAEGTVLKAIQRRYAPETMG